MEDNLFGTSKPKTASGVAIISADELRAIRQKTVNNSQNDAVVISKNDLDRIKDATVIKTKDQLINDKKLLEEQKDAALAKSKARKLRMQELDAARAQKVPATEWQK